MHLHMTSIASFAKLQFLQYPDQPFFPGETAPLSVFVCRGPAINNQDACSELCESQCKCSKLEARSTGCGTYRCKRGWWGRPPNPTAMSQRT